MQRKLNCLLVSCAMMALCVNAKADENTTNTAVLSSSPSLSATPSPTATQSSGQYQSSSQNPSSSQSPSQSASPTPTSSATPTPAAPRANQSGPIKFDPKLRPENQVPTAAQLESGHVNYLRYCADCHGKDGEGKVGPKLVGSLMVTGPTYGHIAVVLSGHPQSKMPTWGISEVSDEVIASVVTYQRNAWGNGNKKEYGQNAGGVVTPFQVHEYRKTLKNLPAKQDVRT